MSLTKLRAGKVRDLYDAGDGLLLMVASNRVSAFDTVLPQAIPNKGRVLTAMTVHWTLALSDLAPSHLVTADPAELPPLPEELADPRDGPVAGRAMLVRRAEMLPLECIVRGYLAGSAAAEYREAGTVHGMPLPAGLALADRLPEPLFTPSVKAEEGHDRNVSFAEACELIGPALAERARELCLEAYRRAAAAAEARGILVADTKFELGLIEGRLAICDEVLTPDSSRFWPADAWAPGRLPPSFDKQPLRDWVARSGWDKRPPAPDLPPEVVEATAQRYRTAYELLCGASLDDWYGAAA